MYDIAIVGGGPAGATLARLIGDKYRVMLLEKRTFGNGFNSSQKCCGGLLAPDAQKMLASFGLGLPKSVILSPQMFSVRTIDIDNGNERYYQRHYININRDEFDKWLESLIPSSVEIINGSIYLEHRVQEDHVDISFSNNGKFYKEKARLIIGADGAFSKVRRLSFPDHRFPKAYIAIQEWFETNQKVNYYGAVFDSQITDFYSWIIPKEDYLIVGSALSLGTDVHERFNMLKSKLRKYGFKLNKSMGKNSAYLLRPLSTKEIVTGGGRVGLAGEAAGFISPSSAEGISYAFRSALALSRSLKSGMEGWHDRYKNNTVNLRRNIFLKNAKIPFMYNKVLRNIIMKSGIMSINMHWEE